MIRRKKKKKLLGRHRPNWTDNQLVDNQVYNEQENKYQSSNLTGRLYNSTAFNF